MESILVTWVISENYTAQRHHAGLFTLSLWLWFILSCLHSLPRPFQCIESSSTSEVMKRLVYLLGVVPLLRLPQARRRACGQKAVEGKAKHLIHASHKVQTGHDLFLQLQRQRGRKKGEEREGLSTILTRGVNKRIRMQEKPLAKVYLKLSQP